MPTSSPAPSTTGRCWHVLPGQDGQRRVEAVARGHRGQGGRVITCATVVASQAARGTPAASETPTSPTRRPSSTTGRARPPLVQGVAVDQLFQTHRRRHRFRRAAHQGLYRHRRQAVAQGLGPPGLDGGPVQEPADEGRPEATEEAPVEGLEQPPQHEQQPYALPGVGSHPRPPALAPADTPDGGAQDAAPVQREPGEEVERPQHEVERRRVAERGPGSPAPRQRRGQGPAPGGQSARWSPARRSRSGTRPGHSRRRPPGWRRPRRGTG